MHDSSCDDCSAGSRRVQRESWTARPSRSNRDRIRHAMAISGKKPSFRAAFREFVERRGLDLSKMQDRQISRLMTEFYVDEIVRTTRPGLLPDDPEDLQACFVDASGDRGVDFVFRSDEGFVLVIQSKYRSSEKSEKLDEVEAFCQVLRRHHPSAGAALRKNQRALEAFADVDWDHDTFELQYITLGKVSDEILKWAETLPECLPEVSGLDERVDTAILPESALNEKLREAISTSRSISEPIAIRFTPSSDGAPWLVYQNSRGARSFIGLVNAPQISELYKKHRTTLFSLNIRNYVGDTSTNKGVISTAVNEPDDFFVYNNGISAVATHVDPDADGGILECSRFSVINGAQTVRSLAKAHAKNRDAVRSAFVMLRVSEISLSDETLLVNITKFNNTQNSIRISDFRSNDPVQRSLAKRFADLHHRNGKGFVYKNKRSERDANRIPIPMEEFAKTVFSFEFGPFDAFGGTPHLFDTGKDGGYAKIFGDAGEVWSAVAKEDFDRLAGTWFICEEVRRFYKSEKETLERKEEERRDKLVPAIVKDALERRWMVFFAVGSLIRARYANDHERLSGDIRRFANPNYAPKEAPQEALRRFTKAGCEILIRAYRAASKDPSFTHRNWFRDKRTLGDIEGEIGFSDSMVDALPLLH
jgi:hypothetical protein